MNNPYWPIYKNLEQEIVTLSNQIHFDDKQISTYSIKISELLIRTVVEFESISKELYFLNGGAKPDDNKLYFDTDCLDFLESNWKLSKKKVFVTSTNFYFKEINNQELIPLDKTNKKGENSSDWLQAYQAIKHHRVKNLEKGNLKNLIRGLAGLFLLNLYYKEIKYDLDKDFTDATLDTNFGSFIFSVKIHFNKNLGIDSKSSKNSDFDECTYLIISTSETKKAALDVLNKFNDEANENFLFELKNEFSKKQIYESNNDIILNEKIEELRKKNQLKALEKYNEKLSTAYYALKFEAVLNKQQY